MPAAGWEHFEHQADIGVRGIGHDLAEAFEQAALAMTAIITEPAGSTWVHNENPDMDHATNWLKKVYDHTGKIPRYGTVTYDFHDDPFPDEIFVIKPLGYNFMYHGHGQYTIEARLYLEPDIRHGSQSG